MDDIYTLTYNNDVVSGSDSSPYVNNGNPNFDGPDEVSGYVVVDYTTMQVLDSSYKPLNGSSVQFNPDTDQYTVSVYQGFSRASGGNATYVYTGESPYYFDKITANFLSNPGDDYETESGTDQPVRPTQGDTVCFCTGTQIRTVRGHVAVEDLEIGDVAITASGDLRPITWVGSRTMVPSEHIEPWNVHPVRVRAGAFGAGLPERDLFLSPGHPVLVGAEEDGEGGHLVPIMCLINGTTVERTPLAEVTYWHVELDEHDVLLAEGLPAESYLDWGDRAFFSEADAHALANPDFIQPGLGARCRPVAIEGAVVENERARLAVLFAGDLAKPCRWPAQAVAAY